VQDPILTGSIPGGSTSDTGVIQVGRCPDI